MYKCLNHFQISRPARAPRFVQLNNGLGIHIPELIPFDPEVYSSVNSAISGIVATNLPSVGLFGRANKSVHLNTIARHAKYRIVVQDTELVVWVSLDGDSSATKKTYNRYKDYSIKKEEINRQNSLVRHVCSLLTSVDKGFNWKLFMGC